jgi:V8-like Glu-specific endopeptidase
MRKIAIAAALLISASVFSGTKGTKVIYGDDNRVDVINSTNSMYVELSKSTAGMIPKSKLRSLGNGEIQLKGTSLQSRGMCASERFSQQPTTANCSGFLVGENLLVTAGHCIRSKSDCKNNRWVFDYKISSEGQTQINVPETSVYECKRIINTVLSRSDSNDFALIELDRKVTDRRVLDYRTSGKVNVGDDLVVIGHPTGLPTKIADGAKVKSISGKFFSANLDTYGGNSGSAVFNANTGIIEGILVRGATDYVYDRNQGCKISNVLGQTEGKGEDVTLITNIPELQK